MSEIDRLTKVANLKATLRGRLAETGGGPLPFEKSGVRYGTPQEAAAEGRRGAGQPDAPPPGENDVVAPRRPELAERMGAQRRIFGTTAEPVTAAHVRAAPEVAPARVPMSASRGVRSALLKKLTNTRVRVIVAILVTLYVTSPTVWLPWDGGYSAASGGLGVVLRTPHVRLLFLDFSGFSAERGAAYGYGPTTFARGFSFCHDPASNLSGTDEVRACLVQDDQ